MKWLLALLVLAAPALAGIKQIALGPMHRCVVYDDGKARCWGYNGSGELGLGLPEGYYSASKTSFLDFGKRKIVQIALGEASSCALLNDASVVCWGKNSRKQLGLPGPVELLGIRENVSMLASVFLTEKAKPVSLWAGTVSYCAAMSDGGVFCWGQHDFERYGLPRRLLLNERIVSGASGAYFHCGITNKGDVYCWGANHYGQLGIGSGDHLANWDAQSVARKVNLGRGRKALQLSAGNIHICALLDDKSVKCWGEGGSGRTGLGTTAAFGLTPGTAGDNLPRLDLGSERDVASVQCGPQSEHCCVVFEVGGTAKCWGYNSWGQTGYAKNESLGDQPDEMGDNLPVIDFGRFQVVEKIAVGGSGSCAVMGDQSVRCWGWESLDTRFNATPVEVKF